MQTQFLPHLKDLNLSIVHMYCNMIYIQAPERLSLPERTQLVLICQSRPGNTAYPRMGILGNKVHALIKLSQIIQNNYSPLTVRATWW